MFDFRKLEAFCRVYEQRSFSRAGEVLFLSQPTVSAHVQSLEKEVGVKLLDRMGRTVLPTPAGIILYKYAIRSFAELDTAKHEIGRLMGDMAGELVLGASTIPASYLLPDLVAAFVKKYPQVGFKLVVGDSAVVIRKVLDGEVMAGVVGSLEKHPELEFMPIVDDELVLVCSPALKGFSNPDKLYSLKDISAWPWIMREEGSGTRKAFEDSIASDGLRLRSLNTVLDVDSAQAALQYALAGLGVTVTSRLVAAKYLERGDLVAIKVSGLFMERKFYVVHNLRRDLFPVTAEFSSFIHNKTAGLRNGGGQEK